MKNMLKENKTRYDHEVAFYNLITILNVHGKKYRTRRYITRLGVFKKLCERKESGKDSREESERKMDIFKSRMKGNRTALPVRAVSLASIGNLELLIFDSEVEYRNDIKHAAYCGCDGCWQRMTEYNCQE